MKLAGCYIDDDKYTKLVNLAAFNGLTMAGQCRHLIDAALLAAETQSPASQTESPTPMPPPSLTTAQESVYAALKKLVRLYEPSSVGGFNPDDVSLHCSIPSKEVQQHLQELETHCHITAIEAPMSAAWPTHYTLRADAPE